MKMISREFIKRITSLNNRNLSSQINIQKLENEQEQAEVIDEELILREEELERKRNKSGLKEHHRNILLEKNPYLEPTFWHHGSLKYIRRTYGRFGGASGVDPALCWPVKKELENSLEYERVAYPFTVQQMIANAKQKREESNQKKLKRQEEIVQKMAKLEQWKQELHDRISKKENEAYAAKQRKERLVEEVRRHFGYNVDPREDRFKELLEKKEKEQKKAMKEERKRAKEEKVVAKLLKKKDSKQDAVEQEN